MSTKLYVGNLSFQTLEADLNSLFAQAGTVKSAELIQDKFSGQSRGFGFVEMSTPEEANKAIEMFNGHELDGRALVVNIARPREERPPRRREGGGGGGHRHGGGGFRDRERNRY